MIDAKSNRVKDSLWNEVKSHLGYLWDDLYAAEIARWNVTWAKPISAYWELEASSGVTNHLVYPVVGVPNLAVPPSPWVQMTLVSDNAADDKDAWTWIRSVEIHYLDWDLNEQAETVELEGLTSITTIATDIRFIQCMHIATVWSWKKAAWNISATHSAIIYSYILEWKNRCESSARRVPAWKRLMIKSIYAGAASGTAGARATVRLFTTVLESHDFTEEAIMFPQAWISFQDTSTTLVLDQPIPIPAWAVVWFQVTTDKWAIVNAWFVWYLENI